MAIPVMEPTPSVLIASYTPCGSWASLSEQMPGPTMPVYPPAPPLPPAIGGPPAERPIPHQLPSSGTLGPGSYRYSEALVRKRATAPRWSLGGPRFQELKVPDSPAPAALIPKGKRGGGLRLNVSDSSLGRSPLDQSGCSDRAGDASVISVRRGRASVGATVPSIRVDRGHMAGTTLSGTVLVDKPKAQGLQRRQWPLRRTINGSPRSHGKYVMQKDRTASAFGALSDEARRTLDQFGPTSSTLRRSLSEGGLALAAL